VVTSRPKVMKSHTSSGGGGVTAWLWYTNSEPWKAFTGTPTPSVTAVREPTISVWVFAMKSIRSRSTLNSEYSVLPTSVTATFEAVPSVDRSSATTLHVPAVILTVDNAAPTSTLKEPSVPYLQTSISPSLGTPS